MIIDLLQVTPNIQIYAYNALNLVWWPGWSTDVWATRRLGDRRFGDRFLDDHLGDTG